MLDLFIRGGWTMYGILAAALVGLFFIIERAITFIWARVNPREFAKEVIAIYKKKGVEAAIKHCNAHPSPVAKVLLPAFDKYAKYGKNKEILEEAIANVAARELAFLDRGMNPLAAVTTLAPMMGFLGTVSGMIRAFDAIALAGSVEPTLVASGISEALITTASGLVVAIPTAAAHVLFSSKVDAYTRAMEEASSYVVEALMED